MKPKFILSSLFLCWSVLTFASPVENPQNKKAMKYVLVIHGGAGTILKEEHDC